MMYRSRRALPSHCRGLLILFVAILAAAAAPAGPARAFDLSRWPDPAAITGVSSELVSYPSHSPFTLREVGRGAEQDPPTPARAALFLPETASAANPAPAVVLLHGAAGVLSTREITYAGQFAAMGVAALVVDAFGARRDRATGFVERLLEVTETMVLADAYAGLRFLDAKPEVDGERVALIGFSYGGISATLGAFAQAAETLNPDGPRFAAHISYYGPCIARFDDNRATGAPVMMLAGSEDAIVDRARCNQILADLRQGGADTEFIVYQGAFHQWDGSFRGPRMIGRNLADCNLRVGSDGIVRDRFTFLHMTGPISRRLILAACVGSEGYLIGRDDSVRTKSNSAVAQFLTRAFGR
jgi:dienelactone hydrolase